MESTVIVAFHSAAIPDGEIALREVDGFDWHPTAEPRLVVTAVRHRAVQATFLAGTGAEQSYTNDFDAIPEATRFRPPLWIDGRPAARVGDPAACPGAPDKIKKGAPEVYIEGAFAARRGDATVHGGVIMDGSPMVIIGGTAACKTRAETLEEAMNQIRASDFAKTAQGQKVLAKLEQLLREGKIGYGNAAGGGSTSTTIDRSRSTTNLRTTPMVPLPSSFTKVRTARSIRKRTRSTRRPRPRKTASTTTTSSGLPTASPTRNSNRSQRPTRKAGFAT